MAIGVLAIVSITFALCASAQDMPITDAEAKTVATIVRIFIG